MQSDLPSIIARIERYCEAVEIAASGRYAHGNFITMRADYCSAMRELRALSRERHPDPLHDTEQAMSRGWR